jgi:hypothetical protein
VASTFFAATGNAPFAAAFAANAALAPTAGRLTNRRAPKAGRLDQ